MFFATPLPKETAAVRRLHVRYARRREYKTHTRLRFKQPEGVPLPILSICPARLGRAKPRIRDPHHVELLLSFFVDDFRIGASGIVHEATRYVAVIIGGQALRRDGKPMGDLLVQCRPGPEALFRPRSGTGRHAVDDASADAAPLRAADRDRLCRDTTRPGVTVRRD